ncbi:hypothetical protein ACFRCQ_25525 [Cytobacillus firmus]|uniref:hypothetical protein n=1 Tax=Cytobacillus firmus TaxID=1399 RepID=UPI00367BBE0B
MKFAYHLSKQKIQQFNQLRRHAQVQSVEHKQMNDERFSRRELEDLMGTRRDTYKRVNGAVRRR